MRGSPEHKRRWRGGATAMKIGGNSSSTRAQKRARESSGMRGRGVGCSGGGAYLLSGLWEHRGGGCREVMTGAKALTPLMAGAELRRGLGNQLGGVNALTGHLKARSWAADMDGSGGDMW
jgi:hypothetical protein